MVSIPSFARAVAGLNPSFFCHKILAAGETIAPAMLGSWIQKGSIGCVCKYFDSMHAFSFLPAFPHLFLPPQKLYLLFLTLQKKRHPLLLVKAVLYSQFFPALARPGTCTFFIYSVICFFNLS
jgi:hypothetical protein